MHEAAHPAGGRSSLSRLFAPAEPEAERVRVSFPDLVRVHLERNRAIEAGETADRRPAEDTYQQALREFEREEGQIVSAYWCTGIASAAALTVRPRWRLLRRLGWPQRLYFHRASDWSTQDEPRIAYLLHECDELAVKTSEVLRGTPHRICMGLAMRSAGNLLSIVDSRSGHVDVAKRTEATKLEERNLQSAQDYYRKAAIRQSQLVYVAGMVLGVIVLAGIALAALYAVNVLTTVDWGLPRARSGAGLQVSLSELFGCATAGALGAVVSVISRISTNTFSLDFEVGRVVLIGIGMFRPFLGAVFGLALYASLVSGLLQLFLIPSNPTKAFYFFLAISFMAGFSERWARGVLAGVEGGAGKEPAAPAAKA